MISVVIVGIDQWEEYTRPLINQIWGYHPDIEICVIDNGSEKPYPKAEHIHRIQRCSYAAAINYGIRHTTQPWILSLNNDVKCTAPFEHLIEPLQPNSIYARQIITEDGHVWLGNWLALIPRDIHWMVGDFDENFKVCGFEDADYCIRAKTLGIDTKPIDLPFTHMWGKTRWTIPGYEMTREENRDYFEQKHGYRLGDNMQVIHD
jgi:hypothetical protein